MVQLYSTIELLTLLITGVTLFYLMKDEHSQEQKLMMFMLILGFVHTLGAYIEINATTMEGIMDATMVEYVGNSFYSLAFLMFVSLHCNKKLKTSVGWLFFITGVISVMLVWTNRYTGLYYTDIRLIKEPFFHAQVSYGPLVGVFLFTVIVPYALTIYRLVTETIREQEAHRKKTLIFLIGLSILPVVSMALYMTTKLIMYDLTPVIASWVSLVALLALYSSKTFDINRLAARRVFDIMDDGVITLDSEKNIILTNLAAQQIFPELQSLKRGANISNVSEFPAEVMSGQGKNEFEKDGRLYEMHMNVVRDEYDAIRGYAILIFDQTEMYDFFDELVSMKNVADKASKAKSEFLTSLSFEIRTPMNSIMGLSEMILEQNKGGRGEELSKDLMVASTGLLTIINNLLDISKIETGKMELQETEYSASKLIHDVRSVMQYIAADKGLDFDVEKIGEMPGTYFGDAGKIRQVLTNMLNNAIRYTDEGFVKLTLSYNPISDDRGELIFKISDSSIAVKEEEIPVFFDALTKEGTPDEVVNESSGLGLAIIRNLLSLMGGTIQVELDDNGGVVSIIAIPQKVIAREEVVEYVESDEIICPNTRILVVDDNKINLKVAVGLLSRYQFIIDEADSGFKAIEMVKHTPYRLIFMDQMMPEMDGIEATRRIRSECGENGTNATVIALTANAVKGAEEMFLNNGFEAFMSKPIDKVKLNDVIRKYVPVDEQIASQVPVEEPEAVSPEEADKLAMEGVDVREGLTRRRESIDGYLELLELFYTDGLEKVMTIREYAEAKNYHDYEIEVHALKSAAANIGAGGLSGEAKNHEFAARDGDYEFVDNNFERLLKNYELILSEVERVLSLNGRIGKAEIEKFRPKISDDEVLAMIKEALSMLEDFKPKDAMAKVEVLLEYEIDQETRKVLMAIRTKLKLYDDDAAEEMLRSLVEVLEL